MGHGALPNRAARLQPLRAHSLLPYDLIMTAMRVSTIEAATQVTGSSGSQVDIAKSAEIGPQFGILVRVAYCGKIPAEFGNLP